MMRRRNLREAVYIWLLGDLAAWDFYIAIKIIWYLPFLLLLRHGASSTYMQTISLAFGVFYFFWNFSAHNIWNGMAVQCTQPISLDEPTILYPHLLNKRPYLWGQYIRECLNIKIRFISLLFYSSAFCLHNSCGPPTTLTTVAILAAPIPFHCMAMVLNRSVT